MWSLGTKRIKVAFASKKPPKVFRDDIRNKIKWRANRKVRMTISSTIHKTITDT